jgi:hypothetical protein
VILDRTAAHREALAPRRAVRADARRRVPDGDQTTPTPRLRKAQALIALGRSAEGDALLAEIAHRAWHERWNGVAEQARELLERGKRALTGGTKDRA